VAKRPIEIVSGQSFCVCRQVRKLARCGLLPAIVTGAFMLTLLNTLAANKIERKPNVATILIDKVLELARTRPLMLRQIEETLGVRLAENRQGANEYMRFYAATATDSPVGLESVEVRFPTDAATTKQRMMVLVLSPALGLTASEIRERLGEPHALQVGRPNDPEGSSYTYRIKSGEVRFGILRKPNDRIRTIVIVREE
jgi:hypothetical protein